MAEEVNNSSARVEILGQMYNLAGEPDYIRELAQYVNEVMRGLSEHNHIVDNNRLGVLAALDLADECYQLKRQLDGSCLRPSLVAEEESQEGSPKPPLTEEERQRNRERRQQHYTKRTHEKQLAAIVNNESLPAKERHAALYRLGMLRGYYGHRQRKR